MAEKFRRTPKGSEINSIAIVIPAFNEEKNLGSFRESFERQKDSLHKRFPHVDAHVVISDNGSTDATIAKAEEFATVATGSTPRSRGSARNVGFEKAMSQNTGEPKSQVLVSMDADTIIKGDNFLGSIYDRFSDNPDLMVSYGPFSLELTNGRILNIPPLASNMMRQRKYKMRFDMFGRDIKDFMRPPHHHLFPGFNFAVRSDAYMATSGFTHDPRLMDDMLLTLELKKQLDRDQIIFSREQSVITSGRAIETPDGKLSTKKISDKLRGRYVSYGEADVEDKRVSPSAKAVKTFIDATEKDSYALGEEQQVHTIATQRQLDRMGRKDKADFDIRPAINHTSGLIIPEKYALITGFTS